VVVKTISLNLWKVYFTLMESKHSIEGDTSLKNRLEILRKQKGIKQEELAKVLEVSRQTIGSLENGRYNPSIILAFKIARYFNTTIEDIFIYEEENDDTN
jgi:putative transcriptional regulator